MKIISFRCIILWFICVILVGCGQAGRLYIPKPETTTQTTPGVKTNESNTQIRQDAWPR
jgi:predicted small lipoprotein YifL